MLTVLLLTPVRGEDWERQIHSVCWDEGLIVPLNLELYFREFLSSHPTGEVNLTVVPRCGDSFPSYIPGKPAAFFWRIGEDEFYFYCDGQGDTHWRVLRGRNIFDPGREGVTVELASHHWTKRIDDEGRTEFLRRDLRLVVPELRHLDVREIRRLLEYYEREVPSPALDLELADSLDAVCWGRSRYSSGRCIREPQTYPEGSVAAGVLTQESIQIVTIYRDGQLLYRKASYGNK